MNTLRTWMLALALPLGCGDNDPPANEPVEDAHAASESAPHRADVDAGEEVEETSESTPHQADMEAGEEIEETDGATAEPDEPPADAAPLDATPAAATEDAGSAARDGSSSDAAAQAETGAAPECFGPGRNLESAYQADALGCPCSAQDQSQCLPDSTGRRVALVCDGERWTAVEGGPCPGG